MMHFELKRIPLPGKSPVLLAMMLGLMALMAIFASSCANDVSTANELVKESESQRAAAMDELRKSTGAIDGLMHSAVAGQPIPANDTQATTAAIIDNLNRALGDLAARDARLQDAQKLDLNDNYQEYLRLLRENNSKLTDTVNAITMIPLMLQKDQETLAGSDQAKTQAVINQVYSLQIQIGQLYRESETLRTQADNIIQDNPGDFGK